MRKYIIGKCMDIIKKEKNYDNEKLAEIEYGLVSVYLTCSKIFVIAILSIIIGIFKEMVIFLLIYNIIRMPSFGIHATKSWICLLVSTIGFVGIPYLCLNINIPYGIKLIIGLIGIILMLKNSPADTEKKPIVNPKRRLIYKIISTIICIIYVIISITFNNLFISNCLILAVILQNIVISPLTYKLFKQPYNNYKNFLKLNPDFLN